MIVCLKSVDATTAVSNVLEQSETGFSKRAERLQPLAVSALDVGLRDSPRRKSLHRLSFQSFEFHVHNASNFARFDPAQPAGQH